MPFLVLFWLSVLWLGYVYAGYPALLALLGLFRRVRPTIGEDDLPTVSVLISARNEEKDIGWKVAETLAWDYPPDLLEVLVASDASKDRTDEILQSITDTRLSYVRLEDRGGKGRALNALAPEAKGDLLFFTDANAHIASDILRKMVRYFADARVGYVTGRSTSVRDEGRTSVGTGDTVYFSIELLIKHLENKIGSVLVCDGAIFCIRRNLFAPLSPQLANDLELPMRIGAQGYWITFERDAVVREKGTDSAREEFSRRRRICAQGVLAFWQLRSTFCGLRGLQFASSKLLRWLTLIPQALLLAASLALAGAPLFALLFWLQVAFYASACVGLLLDWRAVSLPAVFSIPLYVVISSVGALTGVGDACRGKRFDVWESPSLSRGAESLKFRKA